MATLVGTAVVLMMAVLAATPLGAGAATQPTLGTTKGFAVLAGSAVTNTGPTKITGDLGLAAGSSVTGFPPGIVAGATHVNDAVAVQAKTDLAAAYSSAAAQTCTSNLSGDLGGMTLVPGVYCFTSSAQLTGTLTLNGGGNPNAVFIIRVGSMLTTASNSRVALINGGACGVYWQIGSSATLGTGTSFVGTLLVNTSITLVTGATILPGRALTQTGAVTLDSNLITKPPDTCTIASSSSTTTLASSSNPSPTGAPVMLTATVASSVGGTPTGSVTFTDGSTTLGTVPLDSTGKATLTATGLNGGTHTITAVYSGAPSVLPSASTSLIQTVTPTPTPTVTPTPTLSTPSSQPPISPPRTGAGSDNRLPGKAPFATGAALVLLACGTGLVARGRRRRGG